MKIQRIESRENSRVKLAKKVRDGRIGDQIFIEGVRLAEEALSSGLDILLCLARAGFADGERGRAIIRELSERGVEVVEVDHRIFSGITDTSTSQGVALLCRRPATDLPDFVARIGNGQERLSLIVALLGVNNPSNLGAVVRIAEAAGAEGVIVSRNSADVFAPRSLRASAGSAFRVPLWTGAPGDEIVRWARDNGRTSTATQASAADSYLKTDWLSPRLLLFGSEAHGLDPEVLCQVDEVVRIPILEPVESLNLAVAAGVILFEARRQALIGSE